MGEKATLYTTGDITEQLCSEVRNACLQLINQQGIDEIMLVVSSTGGWNHPANWLVDFLRSLPIPVNTHALGEVRSIAVPVFLAGARRTADPKSRFVLHSMTWNFSQSQSYHAIQESMERFEADIAHYVSVVTEATQNKLSAALITDILKGSASAMLVDSSRAIEVGMVHDLEELSL